MHIAVCDDNVADRKQLERLLKRESDKRMNDSGTLYVDSFGDTRVLSKNHMQYDLFFLDMVNEAPDGLSFALDLIKGGVTAPFVLCSSTINYKEMARSYPEFSGNLMFLDKPILKADLSSILDQAVLLQESRIPTIELRSETKTYYVTEDDIVYAIPKGRYVHVFLANGTEVPILTDIFNLYDTISMFTHIVMLGEKSLFNITYMESHSLFHVTLKNGVKLSSTPFDKKFIQYALSEYEKELKKLQ